MHDTFKMHGLSTYYHHISENVSDAEKLMETPTEFSVRYNFS
jgi:hypothetical protein